MRLTILALVLLLAGCTSSSLSGNFCTVAPALTPQEATFAYMEVHDQVFTEQVYAHWALLDQCD